MTKASRILIVDDEVFNIDYLEQELQGFGYETESAENGREALDRIAANPPDLVILDIRMPGIDGLTVCRMIKDDSRTRRIPVIIMTALNAFEDRLKGIEAGADDFLTKPVDDRELLARIKTALRLKHAVDDEIGDLRKVSDHLAKFVPDSVKRTINANPDDPDLQKRERDVSVVFVDISGYARLSEKMSVEILSLMVERYFSRFLDRIQEMGGDISETSGDGLMVVFTDSNPGRHADRAVRTARDLIDACEELNRQNTIQPLFVHIGVNSGPALVGSHRFEGRTGARWVFTVDGPVINLAARLADQARENEILVGPRTAEILGESYVFEKLGQKRLKNLAEPVDLLRLKEPGTERRARLRFHDDDSSRAGQSTSRRLSVVVALSSACAQDEAGDVSRSSAGARLLGEIEAHRGRMLADDMETQLVQFGSSTDALEFAMDLAVHGESRIGVDIGFVRHGKDGPQGGAIDGARDLSGIAEPGQVIVSQRVAETVPAHSGIRLDNAGRGKIGGSPNRVAVFRARRDPVGDTTATPGVVVTAPAHGHAAQDERSDAATSWPAAYRNMESHLRSAWNIEGEVYFLRRLSGGKSGALVFSVDLKCRDFSGQAILKLDDSRAGQWSEREEYEKHAHAAKANPDFAREHLPTVLHATLHAGQVGVLTTIAGGALEYVIPFFESSYGDQLSAVNRFPRGALADWNDSYALSDTTLWPQDLLLDWLDYRLDPTKGRLFDFVTGTCDLSTDEPSFVVNGHWYPNPLVFALGNRRMPERVRLRAIKGHTHSDLHGMNVLLRPSPEGEPAYYFIDLDEYRSDAFLFFDHGYFELSYLLHQREATSVSQWRTLLESIEDRNRRSGGGIQSADDLGIVRLCSAFRDGVVDWMEAREPHRIAGLEGQYMLARVAAGLNFANKAMTNAPRFKALIYAARELKGYLKFQNIDWPKEGRSLATDHLSESG